MGQHRKDLSRVIRAHKFYRLGNKRMAAAIVVQHQLWETPFLRMMQIPRASSMPTTLFNSEVYGKFWIVGKTRPPKDGHIRLKARTLVALGKYCADTIPEFAAALTKHK